MKLNAAAFALGNQKPLNVITERDAGEMVKRLLDAQYSTAFVSKCVQIARGMFHQAVDDELVSLNPFASVQAGTQVNNARKRFIDARTIYTLIDALPCPE